MDTFPVTQPTVLKPEMSEISKEGVYWSLVITVDIGSLQHKGAMSTKPVLENVAKIQRLYVPLSGVDIPHLCF